MNEKYCPIFYFHKDEKYYPCTIENAFNNINNTLTEDTPIYFYHDNINKYITYVLIYAYDSGIHNAGSHITDIEFVRVFYDENGNILKYYLSEHGRDSGLYCNENCIKDKTVYVAKGTHAHYPTPSIWLRGFGFANDVTRKDIIWKPKNIIEITNPQDILSTFGGGRAQWYARPEDIIGAPQGKFINFIYRFFLPISRSIRNKYIIPKI